MNAYLIFDLRIVLQLLKKSNFFNKKKTIFITDKIVIFNLLKQKKISSICLDSHINNSERKRIFLKEYKYFDNKLRKFGEKNYFYYKKHKINSIYNSFRHDIPRQYVGVNFLLISLKRIIVKNNIKKIIYLNDLVSYGNNILNESFYAEVFKLFCKKNFILFEENNIANEYKISLIEKSINIFFRFFYEFKVFNVKNIFNFIKKKISNILINKKKRNLAIIGQACDLNYMKRNIFNFFYYDIDLLSNFLLRKYSITNVNISKFDNLKNIDDIFLFYLREQNLKMERYFTEIISITHNYFKKNKAKKIFWGLPPSPFIRNIILYLKKYFTIVGAQHGGKYFIMEDDIIHRDSDYIFCDEFYSYGFSKSFNKKKFAPNTKIINTGCFKDKYIRNKLSKNSKKNSLNNILFIPAGLNLLTNPTPETNQTTRFNLQKEICQSLNKVRSEEVQKYVKVMPQTYYGKFNLNYEHLESNPIYLELQNYKSIKVNQDSIIKAFQKINPKIIIFDYISTPFYELINSDSEIIVFLDKYNYPKKDVLISLKKRVHIVNSVKEMNFFINKILNSKISKNVNQEFYNLFYKSKINQSKIFKNV